MSITKLPGTAIVANTITTTQLQTTVVTQIQAGASGGPKVSSITYPNNQTATVNTGNESIVLTGTGFEANVQVYVNGSAVPSVSRTNANSLSFTTPALTTGTTYPLYVVNPDGGTAVVIPGMVVSSGPVWVTNSPLSSWGVSSALSTTLVATSDSTVSYALAAGSSLPSGLSLAANGLLSGTLTSPPASDTTYNFTVVATDLETQKSSKAFSITGTVGITATGGTVSNIAGYRVHTFTSSGSFVVTGSGTVEYLVVAGGGGGGTDAGGGGAGGYRTGSGFSVTPGTYSITVGGGGSGGSTGVNGSSSIFSTITSAGGGGSALAGGSGGGGGGGAGGAGNTPSTSPSQGNNGGTGLPATNNQKYGGGGGAGAVGGDATPGQAGHGGSGSASSITGTSVTRAGGGGGGAYPANGGTGGSGGGGNGGAPGSSTSGSTNTGGGGGGGGCCGNPGSAGGSGIVIIRYAA